MTLPVAVKALEWRRHPEDGSRSFEGQNDQREYLERALHPFGAYFLMKMDGRYSIRSSINSYADYDEFDAPELARADAEAKHAALVFASLSPAATPVSEDGEASSYSTAADPAKPAPVSEAGSAALALDSEMRNAEFETWARKNGCHLHLHEGGEDRRYGYDLTERAWLGWCAALAKPASSPACGDVAQSLRDLEEAILACERGTMSDVLANYRTVRRTVQDLRALSQSTSAGRVE